jgi:hypothetical protein
MKTFEQYLEAAQELKKKDDMPVDKTMNIDIDQMGDQFDMFLGQLKEMGVKDADIQKSKHGYMQMIKKEPHLILNVANAMFNVQRGKLMKEKEADALLDRMAKYDFTIKTPMVRGKYKTFFTQGHMDLDFSKGNKKQIGDK